MRKKLKTLSEDDKAIWHSYTKDVSIESDDEYRVFKNKTSKPPNPTEKLNIRKKSVQFDSSAIKSQIHLDKKFHARLKSGLLKPERKLDLHGFTYDAAYLKVKKFIDRAYHDKKRLVLVITGKGNKVQRQSEFVLEPRRGILRDSFPNWLQGEELKDLVLNITQAHLSHGGDGAYYVYLKKNKS